MISNERIGRLREHAKRDESDSGSGNVSGAGLDPTGSGHSSRRVRGVIDTMKDNSLQSDNYIMRISERGMEKTRRKEERERENDTELELYRFSRA